MGTALESTEDRDEREAIHRMIHEVNDDARKDLDLAIREAIKRVIFEGQEMAPIRNTVKAAIAKEVKAEVLEKYLRWRDEDKKDPKKWPFK
jgi:hypothetical protein